MGQRPDLDPEPERLQSRASELLHLVSLLLLVDARRRDGFRIDPEEMALELARIGDRFDDAVLLVRGDGPAWDVAADLVVEVTPLDAGRIGLECRRGPGSVSAELRIDGVLENETFGFGLTFEGSETDAAGTSGAYARSFTAEEDEVPPRASVALGEDGTPPFRGATFVRALAADPQPGAVVRILAAELYADGLVVHYQYDDPHGLQPIVPLSVYDRPHIKPPIHELLADADAASGNLALSLSVADDIGTKYRLEGTEAGGLHVIRATARFSPAPPAAARELRIATYAGEITITLTCR